MWIISVKNSLFPSFYSPDRNQLWSEHFSQFTAVFYLNVSLVNVFLKIYLDSLALTLFIHMSHAVPVETFQLISTYYLFAYVSEGPADLVLFLRIDQFRASDTSNIPIRPGYSSAWILIKKKSLVAESRFLTLKILKLINMLRSLYFKVF